MMLTRFVCLRRLPALAALAMFLAAAPEARGAIKEIAIIHFSHTDVGFTDHPAVCRELYCRYLDIAVDAILQSAQRPAGERCFWTAEATMPVADWWRMAAPARREQFLAALRTGQLEIAALPFNNTPFMNAAQWRTALQWLPAELHACAAPAVAVQNDVNGLPRAAAMLLLDRGVKYLFTGINEDSGGVPFPRPSAFWWKLPDNRRMFVWLNIGYGSGFDFFEPAEWRRGPVPRAADTTYRPPRTGDVLRTDEESLRAAQRICRARVRAIERGGYTHELLTISITNQWRFDNDPPLAPLADFVAAWNRLGLEPRLTLTTAGDAMRRMEAAMGSTAPEHAGEWTDWWANGTASAPREVAASRLAKRLLAAAEAPLWGSMSPRAAETADELYRDLCLFDEHTWGSSLSVAKPYSLDTIGQFTEKSALAYRPMARAEWLLSQRVRTALVGEGEGFFVANPAKAPWSGWVRMIATCLREDYRSLEDPATGARTKLSFEPGIQPWGRPSEPGDLTREDISATFSDNAPNKVAKFWVEKLDGAAVKRLRPSTAEVDSDGIEPSAPPTITAGADGWPASVIWPGMGQPLFTGGIGAFAAVKVKGFAPRWVLADIRGKRGAARDTMRAEALREIPARADGPAVREETPHTFVFTQALAHERLRWGTRVLELRKREARATLTLRIDRASSADPEIYYVDFPLPTGAALPTTSNGGVPFTPFADQLPGTCRDYFAIDSWVRYAAPAGEWLWVSRDAPLIAFGANPTLAARREAPADTALLRAMVFNNFWYTNFVADSHGIMEFRFELVWREKIAQDAQALADACLAEPIVCINPGLPEDVHVIRNLYRP